MSFTTASQLSKSTHTHTPQHTHTPHTHLSTHSHQHTNAPQHTHTPHSPTHSPMHSPQHTHPHTHLSTKTTTVVRARREGMYPRMAIHVACIPGLMQRGKGRLVPKRFNIKLKTYCNEWWRRQAREVTDGAESTNCTEAGSTYKSRVILSCKHSVVAIHQSNDLEKMR